MCGILCVFCKKQEYSSEAKNLQAKLRSVLAHRGPDCSGDLECDVGNWSAYFFASVLGLQGAEVTNQPINDDAGNVLLWNGDIFGGLEYTEATGDSTFLSQSLQSTHGSHKEIVDLLSLVQGPWSFIYWCKASNELWFGRDPLGRHSLVWNTKSSSKLVLSSIGERQTEFREVPAVGIFCAKFSDASFSLTLYPWHNVDIGEAISTFQLDKICNFLVSPTIVAHSNYCPSTLILPSSCDSFIQLLKDESVKQAGNFETEAFYQRLLTDQDVKSRVDNLIYELKQAVDVRCNVQPSKCKSCKELVENASCQHSRVAVLFSGGLDSTVIAALAHLCFPTDSSIDLINVAFPCVQPQLTCSKKGKKSSKLVEQPEKCDLPVQLLKSDSNFESPDRVTGKASYAEMLKIFPNRQFNFIEVNITKEELKEKREECIADLIFPLNSILDDSLGCALWFAARGQGIRHGASGTIEKDYVSPANVLLLGMGADELLGGYSKYRKEFGKNQDWLPIAKLLAHDLAVIPYRNLGRDDRVVSHSGRQPRFPFLSENVVQYIANLPAHFRTAPFGFLPSGVGEKLLLRLAAFSLGLKVASTAPKRALQFGSKIANLEGKNEQGHNVCPRLLLLG